MFLKGHQLSRTVVKKDEVVENVQRALIKSGYAETTARMMAKDWDLMKYSESLKTKLRKTLTV